MQYPQEEKDFSESDGKAADTAATPTPAINTMPTPAKATDTATAVCHWGGPAVVIAVTPTQARGTAATSSPVTDTAAAATWTVRIRWPGKSEPHKYNVLVDILVVYPNTIKGQNIFVFLE